MSSILLSILICAVSDRISMLCHLVKHLEHQCQNYKNVEILISMDNRMRTTGQKRNDLIEKSQGLYVAFIDDDDTVSDNYVSTLMYEIENNLVCDCIVFKALYRNIDHNKSIEVIYDKDLIDGFNHRDFVFHRKPNHLMCFARRIAIVSKFEDCNMGEDTIWANTVHTLIKYQIKIPNVLYFYDFRPPQIPQNQQLIIHYGNVNRGFRDVTWLFNQHFLINNNIDIPQGTKFNNVFGDPVPNVPKILRIMNSSYDTLIDISEDDIHNHGIYRHMNAQEFINV